MERRPSSVISLVLYFASTRPPGLLFYFLFRFHPGLVYGAFFFTMSYSRNTEGFFFRWFKCCGHQDDQSGQHQDGKNSNPTIE